MSGGIESRASLVITPPLRAEEHTRSVSATVENLRIVRDLDARMHGKRADVGLFKVDKFGEPVDHRFAAERSVSRQWKSLLRRALIRHRRLTVGSTKTLAGCQPRPQSWC